MSLFLSGDFHAAYDKHALLAPNLLGYLHLSGGVVVADGYHVEMQLLGLFDDGSWRHIDITARRKHRVEVKVGSIFFEFRQLFIV